VVQLTFFLLLQQWFLTISLKGGSQIQTYDFVGEPQEKFYHKSIDTFVLLHRRSLLHKILEVLLKTLLIERNPFPAKNQTDPKLTEYIFRLRSRHQQLLFKQNLLQKDC